MYDGLAIVMVSSFSWLKSLTPGVKPGGFLQEEKKMKYNIQFKMKLAPHQLKAFKKFLSKGPYSQVNKMLAKIDEQVKTQDMNAAAATAMGDTASTTTTAA